MSNIDDTLAQRGSRYGAFTGHADITQALKQTMGGSPRWHELADDQKEALEMVAHKIGRILNGDPNYIDSWTDIIGYTRLVEKRLIDEQPVVKEFAFTPQAETPIGTYSETPPSPRDDPKDCACIACQIAEAIAAEAKAKAKCVDPVSKPGVLKGAIRLTSLRELDEFIKKYGPR